MAWHIKTYQHQIYLTGGVRVNINGRLVNKSMPKQRPKLLYIHCRLGSVIRPMISLWLIAFFLLTTSAYSVAADTFGKRLVFESMKSKAIKITGEIVDRYFFVEFSTLSYIDPVAFGYFIAAFENQQIPYAGQHKPVAMDSVNCTNKKCSYALEAAITSVPYTVGFGSSDSISTISATLNFMPGNSEGVPFNPSTSVLVLATNSVIVGYKMPLGYRPIDSKSWVGIWHKKVSNTISPIGKADVNSLQSDGSQAINGIKIQLGAVYAVGLFSGPNLEDIVATTTIKVTGF
jgi:hypothetical protein